ncbi:ROK family protein [Nautilia sp.]
MVIDVGGTYVRYKTGDEAGILKTEEVDLIPFLERLINKYVPERMVIAFAGQVEGLKIISSPNTSFENIDLKETAEKYGVEIILQNDMKCAALAQSRYFKSGYVAALYSGTGLGCGVVDNGALIKGVENFAGEIGHIPYKSTPFKCKCGKNNCLELTASGSGIKKWSAYYGCEGLKCERIREMYIEGMLSAVGTVCSLFNPEIVVLGGGVMVNNKTLFDEIIKRKEKYLPSFVRNVSIKLTEIKDAPLKGAEILLKEKR